MTRERADRLLVARGLFATRAQAQAAIAAGTVVADGRAVAKPSDLLAPDAAIEAAPAHPWVSRGGVKLAHALDAFGIDPAGRVCLDVGASTGGFTDVLLARGAATVVAVDVGHGQLHPKIAGDPRVVSLEGKDVRDLAAADLPSPPNLIVADVSFAPLAAVLPAALALAAPATELVALVKPQFEVGRAGVGKGGIVRDPALHEAVCRDAAALVAGLGWRVLGTIASPIAGGDGNREFLLGARRG
ncbi:MAG TPA: TlyA family RNA methyltransferase [Hyphomicrobiales bacterium]|nr:TlyA family RNA methyltransferase [Hyphomicrobiales bacterium]